MISLTSPVRTRAHTWPAGLKLSALCVATVVLFSQHSVLFHVLAFFGATLLYALPGKQFFVAGASRLIVLWPFVALVMVWHVITGAPIEGGVIVLRLVSAVAMANLVTMTTSLSQMVDVIRFVSTPLRRLGVRTRALELGIALVVRFTPALAQKGAQLTQSWSARSAKRANWRIIMPFTILAIDDAEQVAEALKARGGV